MYEVSYYSVLLNDRLPFVFTNGRISSCLVKIMYQMLFCLKLFAQNPWSGSWAWNVIAHFDAQFMSINANICLLELTNWLLVFHAIVQHSIQTRTNHQCLHLHTDLWGPLIFFTFVRHFYFSFREIGIHKIKPCKHFLTCNSPCSSLWK